MKKLATLMLASVLAACASAPLMMFGPDTVAQIPVGTTKAGVVAVVGQPLRRTVGTGGEIWTYRKPAAGRDAVNTTVAITSFGLISGSDSAYADILRVTFSQDRVIDVQYAPNVTEQ